MRKLLAKREGVHRELTNEARRDWTNLIEYNRQDVLGMIHLVGYVKEAGGLMAAGDKLTRGHVGKGRSGGHEDRRTGGHEAGWSIEQGG